MTRGVLYITFGTQADAALERSLDSLRRYHPELPVHVHQEPMPANLLCKAKMGAITPFDQTLFLDADTIVMSRLDFGFGQAQRFGLACCINECPWARRYPDFSENTIEYNTGVLFFTRQRQDLFNLWADLAPRIKSNHVFVRQGKTYEQKTNDQASFAKSVETLGISPFVLPLNWNFRPQWHSLFFGPIRIWHGYEQPPPATEKWNEQHAKPGAPIQFATMQILPPG